MDKNKEYIKNLEKGNKQQRACLMILDGAIDAPHHRQWYLDQALRLLAGVDEYNRLIAAWEQLTGETWDTGIAP